MSDFIGELHSLCKKHGIEFAAICAREYDGTPIIYHHSWSIAVDPLMRRQQAAQMHFDLVGLADEIRSKMWPPHVDEEPEIGRIEIKEG